MTKAKARTIFACEECGGQTPKWEGRCPQCSQWNTLVKTQIGAAGKKSSWPGTGPSEIQELAKVTLATTEKIPTSFPELNRAIGGGIVQGAVILLAGEPGVGKSTLLLQISGALANQNRKLLYISGEESAQQIQLRAKRIGISGDNLFVLNETEIMEILSQINQLQPSLVIIDSIQTIYSQETPSSPGSVMQVRECTSHLIHYAKSQNIPILLSGHVTKDGSLAGPKTLEHMVDVVLYFEGDALGPYRILRGTKNRFGSTNEIGVFQMGDKGLSEVEDPSMLFLSNRQQWIPGSVVVASIEGSRPILAEIQALTTPTLFPQPRRTATGIDYQRLLLVTATATKRAGIPLGNQDIIVSVAGGISLREPAADLGIAISVLSSFRDIPFDPTTVAIAEIGLSGELRSVSQIDRRLAEASRLGFKQAILAENQLCESHSIAVIKASSLTEVFKNLMSRPQYKNSKR